MCRPETAAFVTRVATSSKYHARVPCAEREHFVLPVGWTPGNADGWDNLLRDSPQILLSFLFGQVEEVRVACDLLVIFQGTGKVKKSWVEKWQFHYAFLVRCLELEVPINIALFKKIHQGHLAIIMNWPTSWAEQYHFEARGRLDTSLEARKPTRGMDNIDVFMATVLACILTLLLAASFGLVHSSCPEPTPCPQPEPCPEFPSTTVKFAPENLLPYGAVMLNPVVFIGAASLLVGLLIDALFRLVDRAANARDRLDRLWNLAGEQVATEPRAEA